jgi:DDE_Tnp_1-associated
MACAALLCGYRSCGAMAQWGRNYGAELAQALGFKNGKTPCTATFYNVFKGLDRAALEAVLGQWAQGVLQATESAAPSAAPRALAIDGKTLRGSARAGAHEAHLLSSVECSEPSTRPGGAARGSGGEDQRDRSDLRSAAKTRLRRAHSHR